MLEVELRKFSIFILDVNWFRTIYNGPNAIVKRDTSGFFAIDSIKYWTNENDTFVLLEQCEQVLNTSCYLHGMENEVQVRQETLD